VRGILLGDAVVRYIKGHEGREMHGALGRLLFIVIGWVVIGASAASAEPDPKSNGDTTSARLDAAFKVVQEAVANGEVPGAVALVSHKGQVVREEAYGLCDLEMQRPFTARTICWIASITKPVTVAAAMKLVEEGQLALDDPIERYLPEFKEQKDKDGRHHVITIRQLMSHTSGIQANPPTRPSFFFAQEFLGRKIEEIAGEIAKTTIGFEPGSKVQYSNAAPYVLGRIIELQAKRPFHEYVQQVILEPAGMRDTYFIIPPTEAERVAVVYRDARGERVTFFRFDPGWKVSMTLPDGGLFSSPREVAKFLQIFLDGDGKVLSRESVKAMRSEQAAGWGLGWALEADGLFTHTGSSGVSAWADPKTGVVGVLFCQVQNPQKVDPLQARFRKAVREAFATVSSGAAKK
jgi:CubicO group peptidase (beta-lactamase class C family)